MCYLKTFTLTTRVVKESEEEEPHKKITTGTASAVERDEDRRSIWEHPMVQTYDPWGLDSGQSERTTQIVHVADGWGVHLHGLVDTRLS